MSYAHVNLERVRETGTLVHKAGSMYLSVVLNFMAYDIHDNRTVPSDS